MAPLNVILELQKQGGKITPVQIIKPTPSLPAAKRRVWSIEKMSARYDRQIDILNILMRGRRTTIHKISSETGVSEHTVKRDIFDLAYHFPIFTYSGRGGGIELNACFIINACMLRREEVLLIKYALEYLAASIDDRSMAARNCLKKIFHTEA